jgi:hypothetical protein
VTFTPIPIPVPIPIPKREPCLRVGTDRFTENGILIAEKTGQVREGGL